MGRHQQAGALVIEGPEAQRRQRHVAEPHVAPLAHRPSPQHVVRVPTSLHPITLIVQEPFRRATSFALKARFSLCCWYSYPIAGIAYGFKTASKKSVKCCAASTATACIRAALPPDLLLEPQLCFLPSFEL